MTKDAPRPCLCGRVLQPWEHCWCPPMRATTKAYCIGEGVFKGRGMIVETGFYLDGSPVDYDAEDKLLADLF